MFINCKWMIKIAQKPHIILLKGFSLMKGKEALFTVVASSEPSFKQ